MGGSRPPGAPTGASRAEVNLPRSPQREARSEPVLGSEFCTLLFRPASGLSRRRVLSFNGSDARVQISKHVCECVF